MSQPTAFRCSIATPASGHIRNIGKSQLPAPGIRASTDTGTRTLNACSRLPPLPPHHGALSAPPSVEERVTPGSLLTTSACATPITRFCATRGRFLLRTPHVRHHARPVLGCDRPNNCRTEASQGNGSDGGYQKEYCPRDYRNPRSHSFGYHAIPPRRFRSRRRTKAPALFYIATARKFKKVPGIRMARDFFAFSHSSR